MVMSSSREFAAWTLIVWRSPSTVALDMFLDFVAFRNVRNSVIIRNFLLKMPFNLYFEYRVVSFFFSLVKSESPVYLFSSLRRLGSRTGNFDIHENTVLLYNTVIYVVVSVK
jgi:hypothetical protein